MERLLSIVICASAYFILTCHANLMQQSDEGEVLQTITNEETADPVTSDINTNEGVVPEGVIKTESGEFGPDTPEFWVSENESTDSRADLTDKGSILQDTLEIINETNDSVSLTGESVSIDVGKEIMLHNATEKNTTEAKIRCVLKVLPEGECVKIQLLNATALLKALTPVPNVTSGECALVMFYSPWCPFSAKAAPHFNALPRLYPHFSFYALDAVSYNALNMRYGLVALPSVLLFHNGKGIVKFNESEPILDKLVTFIQKYTGTSPQGNVSVQEDDVIGPISSIPLVKTDYLLILSWLFTVICASGWFMKSPLFQRIVESVRNAWREAEAQHEHTE